MSERLVASNTKLDERTAAALRHGRSSPLQRQRPSSKHNKDGGGGIPSSPLKEGEPLSEMSQTDSSSSPSTSSTSSSSSIDPANEAHSSKSSSHKKEKKSSGSSGSKKRDKKERAKEREEQERFLRQQQELRRKLKSEIETLPQHRRTSLSGGDTTNDSNSSNHSNAKTRRSPSSSPPASFLGGLGSLSSSSENTPTSLLLSPTSPSSSPSTASTKTTPTSSSTNTESLSGGFSGGESGTEGEGSSPSSFSSSTSSHSMSGEERGGKGERESRALQTKKPMTEEDWDRKLANLSDTTVRELLAELLGKLSALEEPFAEELVRTTRRKIALKWVGNDQSSKLRRVSVDVSNYSASSSCPSSGSSSAPSSSLSSSTSAAYLSASCSGEVSLLPAPREQGWHSSMHKTVPVSMVQTRSNSSQSLFSGRSTIATSSTSHNDKDKDSRDSFSGTSSLSANTTSTREQRRSFTGDGLPSGRDHHNNDGNEAPERESSSVSFSVEQHSSSKKEKKSERKSRAPSLTSDDPRANVKATGIDSVSPRKPNKDESKKKRRKSMKFGGGVSLKDSGNFAASSGSSSGSSGSGFSSRKESSKAGKGLFSRLFSGSVNDRVAELIVKEEEEWRLNWPELAALPEEVLVSVHLCSYEQTKGVLYLSTTNICFGERQSGTNESFIFKKRLPLPTLVFVRKTGKGAITVLSHDTKAVLSQFESKQRDLAYETINKLFAPFLPMAQSLHPAILRKDIHTLNLILTSEIAQEKLEELNEDGEPPLASAIRSNDLRITKMMLQYCKQAKMDINFKDRYGYTALHTACLMNVKDEIIEALLNFENIRVTVVNQDGNTPLHYFCKCFLSPSCQDLAQMMINLGADVNFQNESGETALHKAILNDCVRVLLIDCLIENGADVNIVTERGEAPLHYAVRLGRKDVVSQLLCAGADTELVGNLEMKTPLALAQEAQYHEIASHLSRVHDLLSWLKTIGVPELLTFFIQSEIFLDDLLKMSTKKFDRLLDEIEGNYGYEIGENKVRKSDIKNSWQLLKKMEDEKVSKEEVLEMAETLSGKDKQAIIGSLSKIIEESRNKRMTRTSDAAALEAVRKAMAEQAAQEADSADEEEGDDWIMTHSQLEFTKKLGTGASGKVYRGLYKRKDVAIKVLYERGDREEENDPIQELMEEIKVMSNFGESAQEIVRFYGVCLEPAVCLVMEYCERGSLHQVLRDPHLDLSWQMVLSFAKQTARGLELLHGSTPPIFHRDLKTGNLLVTADWHIKVADFGLSRTNTQDNRSALGKLCGTICYCAPELFYGKGFTVSADIFSLGIVFWELVQRSMSGTYKKPYEEYNFSLDVQILVQAAEHGLRPTLPANLPEAVQHLIQRCWSPTVAQRPSAREIVSELEKLEEQYAADPQAWEKTRVVTSSMTTTMTTGGDASTSSSPPSSSDAARAAASAASSSSS